MDSIYLLITACRMYLTSLKKTFKELLNSAVQVGQQD